MNCKRNVPTVLNEKREVEMGVGDWEVLISRPIVRKRSFIVLLFVFNSQNELYL